MSCVGCVPSSAMLGLVQSWRAFCLPRLVCRPRQLREHEAVVSVKLQEQLNKNKNFKKQNYGAGAAPKGHHP